MTLTAYKRRLVKGMYYRRLEERKMMRSRGFVLTCKVGSKETWALKPITRRNPENEDTV